MPPRPGSSRKGPIATAPVAESPPVASSAASILSQYPDMRAVFAEVGIAAPSKASIIIAGERGTGKELVAQAIHELSPRSHGPFVRMDLAGVPQLIIQSTLFGQESGIFQGATQHRGIFEIASGGTLLLVNICDIPLDYQPKLLRAIEEGAVRPLGGREMPVDVRILCTSDDDIKEQVEDHTFREDLFHRLNTFYIEVPPLRARKADLPILVRDLIAELNLKHGCNATFVSEDLLNVFINCSWPGNVRELKLLLERAVILAESGPIGINHVPPGFGTETAPPKVLANRWIRELSHNAHFGQPLKRKNWPNVIVLMPFVEGLKPVFEDHIRPIVEQLGKTCTRIDEFISSASIMQEAWSALCFCDIVIADCTGKNPNVFYELGIAHTLGKPAIIITQSVDDAPFDVRHLRQIVYEYPTGMQIFEQTLKRALSVFFPSK